MCKTPVSHRIDKLFLRPNIAVEPLIDQWYAWPHLIAPATAARNLTHRHLRIMESYLENPEAHAAASRAPGLAGGPFMNFEHNQVAAISALRDHTVAARRNLIEMSAAIDELDSLLNEQAKGYSLEPLYRLVPAALQGYVELGYDLRNQASFRFIERLLYTSKYHDPAAQSFRLSAINDDSRPFIFSTPRLDSPDSVGWRIPFAAASVDAFYRLKSHPASFSEIRVLLGVSEHKDAILRSFLTDQKPLKTACYAGAGLRWKYFGHACVLIESSDFSILTDPAVSYAYDGASERFTYADLPETIDFVLLTHAHQDHVLLETLLQLRDRIGTILVPRNSGGDLQDPSLKLILEACGFKHVREIDEMETIDLTSGTIQAIPFTGEHCDLAIRSKTAWLVRAGYHSMLLLADSRNLNPALYRNVHEQIGDVETIFIGMECDGAPLSWIYGPLLSRRLEREMDQSRRANASDYSSALGLVEQFKCKELYVYAMGQEPWLQFISSIHYDDLSNPIVQSDRVLKTARQRGIVAERLFGCKERILPARAEPSRMHGA
jgi:L-ascorbate metabolism protein UlaG (beta-lactamase superfamily)